MLSSGGIHSCSQNVDPVLRQDILAGLSSRPRFIPARCLYDRVGSELFEAITKLPEYYVSRTERALLSGAVSDMADLIGHRRAVIEFGSGSAAKTPIVLSALKASAYVPIDIATDALGASAEKLSAMFPNLPVYPLEADFTEPLRLPAAVEGFQTLGFFPGSTIGNLLIPDAVDLLRRMAVTLGSGSMLLIGIDRIKDPKILVPAYDDAEGVTAAFNLNLLSRINRELDGSVPIDAFRHVVRWNDVESRMEMHLEAKRTVAFEVDGQAFSILKGETIHTENSLKYGQRDARVLLRAGGWTPIAEWTDQRDYFSLILAAEGARDVRELRLGEMDRLRSVGVRSLSDAASASAQMVLAE